MNERIGVVSKSKMCVGRLLIVFSLLVASTSGAIDLKDLRYHENAIVNEISNIVLDAASRYANDVKLHVQGLGRDFPLRLYKNDVIPQKGFQFNIQDDQGKRTPIRNHNDDDADSCYYHGYIEGRKRSSVVMSTCDEQIEGRINDEDGEGFVIEPHPLNDGTDPRYRSTHIIYNTRDIMNKRERGSKHTFSDEVTKAKPKNPELIDEVQPETFENPALVDMTPEQQRQYHVNPDRTKYIEVYPVLAKRSFDWLAKGNVTKARKYVISVVNALDHFFKLLGRVRAVLVGIEIWNVKGKTHREFARWMYAFGQKVHFDVAPYLDSYYGGGYKSGGNVCEHPMVVAEGHSNPYTAAEIVAHEIGHAMLIPHDNYNKCKCPKHNWCIMNPYVNYYNRAEGWSSCSMKRYKRIKNADLYTCLDNIPGSWGPWYCPENKCGVSGTRQRTKACTQPDYLCDQSKLIEKGGKCLKYEKCLSGSFYQSYWKYKGKKCAKKTYKKKGCYDNNFSVRGGDELFNWRSYVKWYTIRPFTDEMVCACAKAAKDANVRYFGIFWWGICFRMPDSDADWVYTPGRCIRADQSYKNGCPLDADYECLASDSNYFVYENTDFKASP